MIPKTFWIAGLLLSVPAGCLQQRPSNMQSFSQMLTTKIQPGDSSWQVQRILGPGTTLTAAETAVAAQAVRRWQIEEPMLYPAGAAEGDVFLRWKIPDGCNLQLQFRNDRLINHAPQSYAATAATGHSSP